MSLIAFGRYISIDVKNPIRGYLKPYVITSKILDQSNGHSMRPNMVAFKYLDIKKDVNLDAHVKVFNFAMKVNAETF